MIALELVPKTLSDLIDVSKQSLLDFPELKWINVPDVLRVEVRAQVAANAMLKENLPVIPHFRAIDYKEKDLLSIVADLVDLGLEKMLIVSGDIPKEGDFTPSGISPIDHVKVLKSEFPDLGIYGALDPYRVSFIDELKYSNEKLEAGFDGLFTQPFFSAEYLDSFLKYFDPNVIWAGISPVTKSTSLNYWTKVNKVPFPKGFDASLDGAVKISKEIMEVAEKNEAGIYFMPITVSAKKYLPLVLKA